MVLDSDCATGRRPDFQSEGIVVHDSVGGACLAPPDPNGSNAKRLPELLVHHLFDRIDPNVGSIASDEALGTVRGTHELHVVRRELNAKVPLAVADRFQRGARPLFSKSSVNAESSEVIGRPTVTDPAPHGGGNIET
jgi:hypothetical protein